ncbi:hypothetical protein ABBQ32_010003 [Trebouxia sp. C0010 RCD-2024]
MSQPVLVIGAGFAGLSLARTLLSQSIPVRVFDSSPQLRTHSYGITLLSWAYEPLASLLDLGSVNDLKRTTATDSAVGGLGALSLPASFLTAASTREEQHDSYRCSRSKLSKLLAQGVNVEFDCKLESIHSSSTGVLVRFKGGQTAEGILAVGADGVHSAVREGTLPGITPSIIPALTVNGSLSLAQSDFLAGIRKHMHHSQVIVGSDDRTTVTIAVSSHTESEVRISWTLTWCPAKSNQYKSDRQSIHDANKIPFSFYDRLAKIGPLAEPFQSVLNHDIARQTAKYNWLMRSVRVPKVDLMQTAEKGIVLVGDAAHAMPIIAGQGANHALLDGFQLGKALGNAVDGHLYQAVHSFYEAQHDRWETGVVRSEQSFFGLHDPVNQWLPLVKC